MAASLFGLALLQSPTQALAQTEDRQSVVTVGSRLPTSAARLSADVVVLTGEDLRRMPTDNLADALQMAAGLNVSRTGGPGQPTSLLIRGASASSTLVIIDGVRVGSATLGQFDFATLGVAGIERVEVLRGPGSSLYGADAVGGVVLITTRGAGGPTLRAQAGAGSLGSSEAALHTRGGSGPWELQLGAGRQASSGVSALRPGDRFGNHNPDADGYRRESVQGSLGWRIAEGHRLTGSALQTRLFSRYDASEFAPPNFEQDAKPDFITRTNTEAARLGYEGRAGSWNWRLHAGTSLDDSRSGGRQIASFRSDRREAGAQLAWSPSPLHEWVLAWDQLSEQASATDFVGKPARDNNAVTMAYSGRFAGVQLQAEGREDRNSVYGSHRTARSGLRWDLDGSTALRLVGASTFRAPSFNDLFYPGYGVPQIQPEEGRSVELGLSRQSRALQWQAIAWRNRVRNLIAYSAEASRCPASAAYAFGCAANIGRADLQGFTLETHWGGQRPAWRWAYDHVDARDADGRPLPRRARHQVRLQTDHTVAGWQLGSAWLWQSERREGSAALRGGTRLDVQAVRAIATGWSLQLRLLNALDVDFEPARDYRAPGRQAWAGLRWEG